MKVKTIIVAVSLLSGCKGLSPTRCDTEGEVKEAVRRVCIMTYPKGPCREWKGIVYNKVCKSGYWEELK